MFLPAVLLILLASLTVDPVLAGDCYNEKNYSNCNTCYETFANALVNTDNNLYNMSRAFFPIDRVSPVQVKVTYVSNSSSWVKEYFWILGGFYVYQPITILVYRSLFFSPPTYRHGNVTLILPDDCVTGSTPSIDLLDGFLEYSTQRLKGYAQSQSATPAIDSSYMGRAVRGSGEPLNYNLGNGDSLVAAAYMISFLAVFLGFIGFFAITFYNDSLKDLVKVAKVKVQLQAKLIAGSLLCSILTLYFCILDLISITVDVNKDDLPSYYHDNVDFFIVNIVSLIFYFGLFLCGVIWFLREVCCQVRRSGGINDNISKRITLSCIMIAGSTVTGFAAHLPSILLAWATDPFYASRILLFYLLIILLYMIVFNVTYINVVKNRSNDQTPTGQILCSQRVCASVTISLVLSAIFVTFFVIFITTLVITVPVNNSIETVSDGATTMYNGALLLIGTIVAYRVGWYYGGDNFSIVASLKKMLRNLESSPFGGPDGEWGNLPEETRLIEILKKIILSEWLRKKLFPNPPPGNSPPTFQPATPGPNVQPVPNPPGSDASSSPSSGAPLSCTSQTSYGTIKIK